MFTACIELYWDAKDSVAYKTGQVLAFCGTSFLGGFICIFFEIFKYILITVKHNSEGLN